jgi:hypothetical protein
MGVVTVQHRSRQLTVRPLELRPMWLWALMGFDVMELTWMKVFGDWFDRFSPVTSVATLGGHHQVVMALAGVGFVILAGLSVPTGGFTTASRRQTVAIAAGCLLSVVALAGFISFLFAALFGRFLFGSVRG